MFLPPKKNVFNYHDPPISYISSSSVSLIQHRHYWSTSSPKLRSTRTTTTRNGITRKAVPIYQRPYHDSHFHRQNSPLCVTRHQRGSPNPIERRSRERWSKIEPFILPRNIRSNDRWSSSIITRARDVCVERCDRSATLIELARAQTRIRHDSQVAQLASW